jgi:predicted small metal-binding protein
MLYSPVGMKRLSCRDIGLDCDQVILGDSEEAVIDRAVKHAWEAHAISDKEMTSEMKSRIKENITTI